MSEEESDQAEEKISESAPPDILESINENLGKIHAELKELNDEKLRENVRLAVIIVLFAVPLSFMVNIMSSFMAQEYLPTIGDGTLESLLFNGILLAFGILFLYIVLNVFNPLYELHNDPEIKDLMKKLKNEQKKKKRN